MDSNETRIKKLEGSIATQLNRNLSGNSDPELVSRVNRDIAELRMLKEQLLIDQANASGRPTIVQKKFDWQAYFSSLNDRWKKRK